MSEKSPKVQFLPSPRLLEWEDVHNDSKVIERVRPYTMVPTESLIHLARVVRIILTCGIPGQLVECGVWRGGSSFLMADLLKCAGASDRKVWLYDSYEGLPPPKEIDGKHAREYVQNKDHPNYRDNCAASIELVERTAAELGVTAYTEFIKGWFEQTLPTTRDRVGPIALLRIDADWHDSVYCCLEHLYDQVVDGGFVIFDDYYTYDGCATAVHEFLGKRGLPHRLESVIGKWGGADICVAAFFRKGGNTWQLMDQIHEAAIDIAGAIPHGGMLVVADGGVLGSELTIGQHAIPFCGRDGQYWGPPADGAMALRELKRSRTLGADFLVFAWPAFWWLDYYRELREFLDTHALRILENRRVIVFDLHQLAG